MKEYVSEKIGKLIVEISNDFEYWFTFVIHPAVEPTNNRSERALRETYCFEEDLGDATQ